METIIVRFVTALREKGLRVSPGESLDAVCALALGGLDERKSARALLQLTLVKNVHDRFSMRFSTDFSAVIQLAWTLMSLC